MNRISAFAMAFTALLFTLSESVRADIYQFTDEQGVIHFSNISVGTSKNYKHIKSSSEKQHAKVASPRRVTTSYSPLTSSKKPSAYVDIIHTACDRHGIDPALVHAIVKVESDFNPYALSRKGAMGLMQLMPQTAADMKVMNTFNPNDNIDGGVKFLRYLIDRYNGNLSLALAAYNCGETAVKKWGAIPPFPETQNYVRRILTIYNGGEQAFMPRHTIYISYDDDGAILLTDDPGKHPGKHLKRKTPKNL